MTKKTSLDTRWVATTNSGFEFHWWYLKQNISGLTIKFRNQISKLWKDWKNISKLGECQHCNVLSLTLRREENLYHRSATLLSDLKCPLLMKTVINNLSDRNIHLLTANILINILCFRQLLWECPDLSPTLSFSTAHSISRTFSFSVSPLSGSLLLCFLHT